MSWPQQRRKYGNKKVVTEEGVFDGKNEWRRWLFLKNEQEEGRIFNLRRQVSIQLLPKQTTTSTIHLKTKDKVVEKFAEHPVNYIADFVYEKDVEGIRKTIVEDFKGVRTDVYIIKRKMMLYFLGIAIREVKKPTEPI